MLQKTACEWVLTYFWFRMGLERACHCRRNRPMRPYFLCRLSLLTALQFLRRHKSWPKPWPKHRKKQVDTGGHSGSPTEPKVRKSAGKRCGTTLSGTHRIFTRRRSLVRVQQSPPHMKNPNFFPIGNAFGFFIFIKDNSYWYLRPEEFYILRTFFIRIFDFCR